MLKDRKYGDFTIGSIFTLIGTTSTDAKNVNFTTLGDSEFIGRTEIDYGVQGLVKSSDFNFPPNPSNTITISQVGTIVAQYRDSQYYTSQNIVRLSNRKLTRRTGLFIVALLNNWLSKSGFNGYTTPKQSVIKQGIIKLPLISHTDKNNYSQSDIDWQFMEEFIKELEAERIQELEAYLIATNLNDYHLTDEEHTLLDYKPKFKSFKLASTYIMRGKLIEVDKKGVFDIVPTKKKINANSITFDGQFPYVARGESKNGIRGYINFDEQYLNPKDTISFGQDTATMYYQPNAYFTGDKIQVFKLNEAYGTLTENIALYIISSMKKSFANFVWGQQSFALDVISEIPVELPVDIHGNIDFEYMSQYIQAIKKVSIEDVVRYKDKIITATQNIVNE
ncbi:restriction endonuclease subunit S [Streptococcus acidominimus]|nr:restriction endonuclease subunit S [Streptococcus acidominimus]